MSEFDFRSLAYQPLAEWLCGLARDAGPRIGFSAQAVLVEALRDPDRFERIEALRKAFDNLVAPHRDKLSTLAASAARFRAFASHTEGDLFNVYLMKEPAFIDDLMLLLQEMRSGAKSWDEYCRLALVIDPVSATVVVGHGRAVRHADILSRLTPDPDASRSRLISADVSFKNDEDSILLDALRHGVPMNDEEWRAAARMVYASEGVQRYGRAFTFYQSSFSALLAPTARPEGEGLPFRDMLRGEAAAVVQAVPCFDETLPISAGLKVREISGEVQPAGEEGTGGGFSSGGSGKGGASPAVPPAGVAPISSPESGPASSAAPFDAATESAAVLAGIGIAAGPRSFYPLPR